MSEQYPKPVDDILDALKFRAHDHKRNSDDQMLKSKCYEEIRLLIEDAFYKEECRKKRESA